MSGFDWLPWRRPPPPIADHAWRAALAACPMAQRLDAAAQRQLRVLVARFMQRKRFLPIDVDLDAGQRLLIALQACIPVWRLGFAALRGWQSVIVYPGQFRVRNNHHDASTGVVTEGNQTRIGEAWHRGPLVLSWAAIEHDLEQPWDGYNVTVHEIAHKLDMLDGPPDGVPPLPRGMSRREWIDTFQRAYDGLVAALAHGEHTLIDPYAATNAGEYFAVVSELHFSNPATLRQAEPAVADLLHQYYGPSPAP
jgi:Mlc titration factor MtfA (ptsG expression regulator)